MKHLLTLLSCTLLFLFLLAVPALADTPDLSPFEALETYTIDYDEMLDELWVESSDLASLLFDDSPLKAYITLAFSSYTEAGVRTSMLQLYAGMNTAAPIDNVTILTDGVRYQYEGISGASPDGNYAECMLPIGTSALEMLGAIAAAPGEVKVLFSTASGDIDAVMTPEQIFSLAELYTAYLFSDFYDAPTLFALEYAYPLTKN